MTRVIDLSAPPPRPTYRPMFRINDIDRRRDRKVVRLPNDGPGMSWEDRVAASDAKLAKIIKPRAVYDTMISDYVLLPMLEAIADGVVTQIALVSRLGVAASTISGRCSQAVKRDLIQMRRERTGSTANNAFYSLTDAGRKFIADSAQSQRLALRDFQRAPVSEPKKRHIPPSELRDAILTAMLDGEWWSSARLAAAIGRPSNNVSSAARRCVEHGHVDRDDTTGIGSKALYRITDTGRYYLKTGVA